jgi:hypothetical protein
LRFAQNSAIFGVGEMVIRRETAMDSATRGVKTR